VSLQRIAPWSVALLAVTVVGMMITAHAGSAAATWALAAAFVAGAIAASLRANAPYWRAGVVGPQDHDPMLAARRNTRLAALTYAWAGLAMQGLYTTPLTGLRWQHGWQYALAFALVAFGAFFYARALGTGTASPPHPRLERLAAPLAIAQAIAAACGLAYLAGTGKALSTRADWAANIIFVSAALAIMVLSAIGLRTHVTLTRRPE